MRNKKGFTLIELLVTIAIVSILMGVAVPGFISWLPRWQLKSAATDVFSNLQLAKISAIRRGTTCRVTFSAGQYTLTFPSTGDTLKTVSLADYGKGVQFLAPDNLTTYTAAVINFNKRGLTDQVADAIVYLTNAKKDVHYQVLLTPAAVIKLQKKVGNQWK
ncbi:MAG: GspH/FimT family pseudopilin [Pseudomonadota bacterium]